MHPIGQAHHFNFMAPVRSDWGIERYNQETRRLYSVLNTRLQSSHFLAGEKFTIADIASVFWVRISVKLLGWDLAEWPAVQQWHDGIMQRDMVRRAMKVPSPKIPEDAFLKMMAVKREALMAKANSDLK
jgi:glutathione S-transferase